MEIRKILIALIAFSASFASYGQLFKKVVGNDVYEWREYKVQDYHKINISDAFNITCKIDPDSAGIIKVYGEENILDMMTLKSEKGKLTMKLNKKLKPEYGIIMIQTYSSSITEIDNQGAATVDIKSAIEGPEIKFTVLGSGQINACDVSCGVMKINVGGAGDVSVKGKAGFGDFSIQGAGDIKAESLNTEEVNATITGNGVIKCHAEKNLKTFLTGSGQVKYKGRPELKSRTVGSGTVQPL